MPDKKKPFDWRRYPLPPLPELNYGPQGAETTAKPFVPPRFTPDQLRALREAPEDVKRKVLDQHLARRSRVAEGSEIAVVLDERIVQIRAILGERPNASQPAAQAAASELATAREKFIQPILNDKGWSILDWAGQARVDQHTASDYLKGKTNPYPSTRKKLAVALGIEPEKLPK